MSRKVNKRFIHISHALRQLENELQQEKEKQKLEKEEYKQEIEKLKEDNDRQQKLLSVNLNKYDCVYSGPM